MYQHYVFDVDGTLIDTEQVCLRALQKLLRLHLKKNYDCEELRKTFGLPSERVLPLYGLPVSKELLEEWNIYYGDFIGAARLYEGAKELLAKLRECGSRLGIVTSRSEREVKNDPLLELLLPDFELVVTADCTTEHKPSPEPMRFYLQKAGAEPHQVLYVGDTPHDSRCAQGAGVDFALATWGAANTDKIPARFFPSSLMQILDLKP